MGQQKHTVPAKLGGCTKQIHENKHHWMIVQDLAYHDKIWEAVETWTQNQP